MNSNQKVLDLIPESLKPKLIAEIKELLDSESNKDDNVDKDIIAFGKQQSKNLNNGK